MENITFEKIKENDISELTKISIEAFHSDYTVGAPNKVGGPPGYDSCQFYNKMMRVSKAFYKIVIDKKIIGGFIIFDVPSANDAIITALIVCDLELGIVISPSNFSVFSV